jgi:peptide chain release factor 2
VKTVTSEELKFWADSKLAGEKMKELSRLQSEVAKLTALEEFVILGETDDEEKIKQSLDDLSDRLYLSGEYDSLGAIISIHSGQGGVEAMDWAQMVYRMYVQFCKSRDWIVEEIDLEAGSEAGIKEVVFEAKGDYAYGFMKYEAGVHRLVRQSPFNADHLRQTSFALVEVLPDVDEVSSNQIQIRDEDLDWDFFRSGGHGGQNVNKVSSAVRLTHKPSGIVVTSQKERDQSRNREIALKILRGKLVAIEEEKIRDEHMRLRGKHVTPGWGNQIRSYVLHPYHLVKDLRTEYEETDSDKVLEGHIDEFLKAELHFFATEKK